VNLFRLILTLCLTSQFGGVFGQFTLSGLITEGKEKVPYAVVSLDETPYRTMTNDTGFFEIKGITSGTYLLRVKAIGFEPYVKRIEIHRDISQYLVELKTDQSGLREVVVSGTMKDAMVYASPIKIEALRADYLQVQTAPMNLMQGLSLINGVQEEVTCGVCQTSSISINGLPGPYTAVLIDGTPMYGNLASVYGLNGIPTNIIDRIEIIKGPHSSVFGSEAVAGIINVITKNPDKEPLVSADMQLTTHAELFSNVSFALKTKKWKTFSGINHALARTFHDINNDGFGDFALFDRYSFFSKNVVDMGKVGNLTLFGKVYSEDRRNGVEEFVKRSAHKTLRGNDSIYGESIYTFRAEVFGNWKPAGDKPFRVDYSFSHHDQDSYYGDIHYTANQQIGFINALWLPEFGKHHLTAGLTGRMQFYKDNTSASESISAPRSQWIPGLFFHDDFTLNRKFRLVAGGRLDYYNLHGVIGSPRLSVKYNQSQWLTLRANGGTGFRVVNLFTEDHAFITGQRMVVIAEELRPEQTVNGTFNLNWVFAPGKGSGTFDLDVFFTHFFNRIIPDYDEPQKIIYANSEGYARSMGISASVNMNIFKHLNFNTGITLLNTYQQELDSTGNFENAPIQYAPRWSGVATLSYRFPKQNLILAYTARVTGPMALPEVFDLDASGNPLDESRPLDSRPFSIHSLQLNWRPSKKPFDAYIGVQNIFNFFQPASPLSGFNDPNHPAGFSPFFDTAYAYAPMQGREVYVGVRWRVGR
jgi:outer membrane receptor for ferrienterochelin and colicins